MVDINPDTGSLGDNDPHVEHPDDIGVLGDLCARAAIEFRTPYPADQEMVRAAVARRTLLSSLSGLIEQEGDS